MFHAPIGGGVRGGWFLFQMGRTSFLSGIPVGDSIGFGGGGGVFEKNRKTGWASPMPPCPPTMGNPGILANNS